MHVKSSTFSLLQDHETCQMSFVGTQKRTWNKHLNPSLHCSSIRYVAHFFFFFCYKISVLRTRSPHNVHIIRTTYAAACMATGSTRVSERGRDRIMEFVPVHYSDYGTQNFPLRNFRLDWAICSWKNGRRDPFWAYFKSPFGRGGRKLHLIWCQIIGELGVVLRGPKVPIVISSRRWSGRVWEMTSWSLRLRKNYPSL